MRLAHVLMLMLMLSCGCSLETRPQSAGALRSVRTTEPALQPVSFEAWRRVDWSADAAADGGRPVSMQGSPDAAMRGLPARASADNVRPQSVLRTQPEAGAEAAGAGAGQAAVDASVAPANMEDIDAGSLPPQMQGPAGAGGAAGAAAGQGGAAAIGGMDAAVPVDAAVPLLDAGSTPDASDRDGPYRELLERVLETLDGQRGGRTAEVRNLIATVRMLLELPESERSRSEIADVLVRLGAANVCRFDNAADCAALCNALERDCSVCRRDVTCELTVNLMCTPQWGFSCDAR